MNYKVEWNEDVIFFPFDTADLYAIYQNQRFSKVKLDELSMGYVDSLLWLVEKLSGLSAGEIRKAVKAL